MRRQRLERGIQRFKQAIELMVEILGGLGLRRRRLQIGIQDLQQAVEVIVECAGAQFVGVEGSQPGEVAREFRLIEIGGVVDPNRNDPQSVLPRRLDFNPSPVDSLAQYSFVERRDPVRVDHRKENSAGVYGGIYLLDEVVPEFNVN